MLHLVRVRTSRKWNHVLNSAIFCFGIPAYSVDSDQKPIQAASHLGPHCLHIFHPSGALLNTMPQVMSQTLVLHQTVQARTGRHVMRRPIRAGTVCICLTYGTLCSIRLVEYDAATNAAVTDISTNNAGPDQVLQYAAPRQGRH